MTNNKPLIFAPGTRVTIDGEPHLITQTSLDTGRITYATDLSAWHDHEDCVFVSPPTEETIAEAIRAIYEESEEEDEDEDYYEDDEDLTMNDGG